MLGPAAFGVAAGLLLAAPGSDAARATCKTYRAMRTSSLAGLC